MEEKDFAVPREVAEQEFQRIADFIDFDFSMDRNSSEKTDVEELRNTIIQYIMRGKITVDGEGRPTVHTKCPELKEVFFSDECDGTVYAACDFCKPTADAAKMYAAVAAATKINGGKLRKLKNSDWKVVSKVFQFFLAD
jgi:hypothetical protein